MAVNKLDYKKAFKELYEPKSKPSLIDVPEMNFIMVDGKGNTNDEVGEYQVAVELLYALSYTIKMSKMGNNKPEGYFEYVVPPLEGLWWLIDDKKDFTDKNKFCWTSMIRQPEFVTEEVFNWACSEVKRKKPNLDVTKARLQKFTEGLCIQMMHIGSYDEEPKTIKEIENYIGNNSLEDIISTARADGTIRRHHEIYLSDPRKIAPEKMKTILRHPVQGII